LIANKDNQYINLNVIVSN